MTKTIDTIVSDIYEVLEGNGGWDQTVAQFLADGILERTMKQFGAPPELRNWLSPSMLGQPCDRKKWYQINEPEKAVPLDAQAIGTFMYGDILEYMVIALAMAAGHDVQGLQEPLDVCGLSGSGDCIIDGMVVDIKSASSYGFKKFEDNGVKEDDPFGYISQLSSYLYAYQDDDRVTEKDRAAFLVVKKDRFKLVLDTYDLRKEVDNKEQEVQRAVNLVEGPIPEVRIPSVPDGKSGNMKLALPCSYCQFKNHCWADVKIRRFAYANEIRELVHVTNLPRVPEIT